MGSPGSSMLAKSGTSHIKRDGQSTDLAAPEAGNAMKVRDALTEDGCPLSCFHVWLCWSLLKCWHQAPLGCSALVLLWAGCVGWQLNSVGGDCTLECCQKLGCANVELAGLPPSSTVVQRHMLGPFDAGQGVSGCFGGAAAVGEVPRALSGQHQAGQLPASRVCVRRLVGKHRWPEGTPDIASVLGQKEKYARDDDVPGSLQEPSMQAVLTFSALHTCVAGKPQWPSKPRCTSQLQTEQ